MESLPLVPYTFPELLWIGDGMYALVLFVCYLDAGCENLPIEVFKTEYGCLSAMKDQRIRQGGCLPAEDYIDPHWQPAQESSDFFSY